MGLSLDDLKYKAGDLASSLKYKIDDLRASPRGMAIVGGGAVAVVLLVVLVAVWVPRIGGNGSEGAVRVSTYSGSDAEWIDKARAAIANDPRFARVSIEPGTDDEGASKIFVRGVVRSREEQMALMGTFVPIGTKPNVAIELQFSE